MKEAGIYPTVFEVRLGSFEDEEKDKWKDLMEKYYFCAAGCKTQFKKNPQNSSSNI